MSLRLRVIGLFALVLLISLALGVLAAALEAKVALREELNAGLLGARQTAVSALEDLPRSDHAARDLRQLVATFDGNRHVLAELRGAGGALISASRLPEVRRTAPAWFQTLMVGARTRRGETLAVPALGAELTLTPADASDLEAVWREFSGIVLVLLGSALAGLALVYGLIGRALRPLEALSEEFVHIGAGDYGGRVAPRGPSEIVSLQRGFNHMVGQLAAMTERNRQLTHHLLTLQEEERLEIARDLHDDIGPHLFAVNMDAEMIAQLCVRRGEDELLAQSRSIQKGISHVQREIRDLLVRLRPTPAVELGFEAALEELIRFWNARRPDLSFELRLPPPDADLCDGVREVAYRVVQEALNNAVRHARARAVVVGLRAEAGRLSVEIQDDGVGGAAAAGGGGFGLLGMAERVRGVGGELTYGPGAHGGWRVRAELPAKGVVAVREERETA